MVIPLNPPSKGEEAFVFILNNPLGRKVFVSPFRRGTKGDDAHVISDRPENIFKNYSPMLGELIVFTQSQPSHKQCNNRYHRCHPSFRLGELHRGENEILGILESLNPKVLIS